MQRFDYDSENRLIKTETWQGPKLHSNQTPGTTTSTPTRSARRKK
jgi:hypothetical protein